MRRTTIDPFRHASWPSIACAVGVAVLVSCSAPAVTPAPVRPPVTLAEAAPTDHVELYRKAGFIVGDGSIPFIGMVRFAATEFLDSTAVVVALSIPPRSLSFVRAGDRYAAFYGMRIDLLRGDAIVRSERPTGEVRVASFAETTRGDEGVIFQRSVRVAPGTYSLRLSAQDSLGTGSGSATASVTVPTMSEGSVAPVIPVFMAEPRQTRNALLAAIVNPRATVRYGRDSVLELYVEAYGEAAPNRVLITAMRDTIDGGHLLTDTIVLGATGAVRAGRATLPVHRLGLGSIRLVATTADGRPIDSLKAAVNLGIDMPVASINELLDAIRYFASDADLQRLRAASDAARPAQWSALVRRSDPNQATPDNEALLEYARRLRVAERFYREEGRRGWQSGRGAVIAALGEPDAITDAQRADSTGSARVLTWEYRRHRLLLVFGEAASPGVWRLTPLSEADFRALLALAGPCVGCR
jgi:GWxTD domain-containing protein